MTDIWQKWADGWDAWDAAVADPAGRDDFAGYDLWRSEVGSWPSIGDDLRPTRPDRAELLPAELDLTTNEISVSQPEMDLTDEILDLADDIEDRT